MQTDAQLLEAWRAGDAGAGTQLFRRNFPSVFRFFQTKVPDAVEELVQRTFLACVEAGDRLDQVVSFRAYLLGIARNQLLRYFSEKHRTRRIEQGVAAVAEASSFDRTGPIDLMVKNDEQRLLLKGLRRLPLDLQIALELFYWERLAMHEIARIIDVPEGTVKSRLHRAKRLLKDLIEGLDASDALRESTVHRLESWARLLREHIDERAEDA